MSPSRRTVLGALASAGLASASRSLWAQPIPAWSEVLAKARGQTVYWNAWAGSDKTNATIAWVGQQVQSRFGVTIQHVRLKDTAEAVTRVVAEKAAGRTSDGGVDLIWINGPNFLAMKQQGLLFGPVTQALPNFNLVDTRAKRSNVIDFTTPVDGLAVPWRMAQVVFTYDSARLTNPASVPRSAPALLQFARQNPGRVTHPVVSNYLGSTFLKQMLIDLLPDPAVLQQPASDASYSTTVAPLWTWYEQIRPQLWRRGQQFPETEAALRQLLNDGEVDLSISFNPTEAATAAESGQLPKTVRSFVFDKGTLGNTSFVAIPFNAAHKEGAMVVANFMLEPAAQAHAQDIRNGGAVNVLDLARLNPEQRAAFNALPQHPALLKPEELGAPQLEPHASWMTRIAADWQQRTLK